MTDTTTDTRGDDARAVTQAVSAWVERVILGLGLCPFAAAPWREGRVRVHVSASADTQALLEDLHDELARLDRTPAARLETTLVVIPHMLGDFETYNAFLDLVDTLIERFGWEGVYQVASFHPDYRFADAPPGAVDHLTNRSPYPVFHLLRESSVGVAVAGFDTEAIPARNVARLRGLPPGRLRELFPGVYADEGG